MNLEAENEFRDIHKIILVGDSGTGKTHIVYCFTKEKIPNNITPTIAVEFTSRLVTLDNKITLKAQIWDTAGQQKYRALTYNYYRKVVGAFIVFDVSRRSTFEHVPQWLQALRERSEANIQIGLLGHKIDQGRRDVSKVQAQQYAAKQHIFYAQTTIRDVQSITNSFKKLLTNIHNSANPNEKVPEIQLNQNQTENSGCSC